MTVVTEVRVRYLARLRELAGTDSETVGQIPLDATLGELYDRLRRDHPALPERGSVRAAVNLEFSDWSAEVPSGNPGEVAFIPPVSGGA